jgi:HAD superfamily hydrolase (TIGR01484 family)
MDSKIKLLAIDIDGTLLDTSGKIDEETKETLKEIAKGKDIKVAIVTSRSLDGVLPVFSENGFKYFPSLIIAEEREIYTFNNGAYVPLSEEWNNWVIKEEEGVLPIARKLLAGWAEEFQRKGLKFSPVSWEIENKRKFPSLVFPDINQAEAARRYVEKELSSLSVPLRAERPAICLDIRSVETGKGKTLNKALEILKILPTSVLCIGDSYNDLEMLDGKYGFKSACPNNAEKIIKETIAKNNGYVARYSYGKGVTEIIEKLIKLGS